MNYKRFFTLIVFVLLLWVSIADADFTVHTIYFKPTDADALDKPHLEDEIADIVLSAQDWYADEMDRNGFGAKTFDLETDRTGKAIVHIVNGRHNSAHYANRTSASVIPELPPQFNPETPPWNKQDNIRIIIVGGIRFVNNDAWGVAWPHHSNRYGGTAVISANSGHLNVSVVTHELSHCFGLYHKPAGSPKRLEHYEARWLDKHYHFNDNTNNFTFPKPVNAKPTLTALKDNLVKFELDATGNQLHQAIIVRKSDILVIGWDALNGQGKDTITIEALRSSWGNTVFVEIMDTRGNYHIKDIQISLPPPLPEKNPDLVIDSKDPETARSVHPRRKAVLTWARLKMERY